MQPEEYDAWYATQRGAWIGNVEYRMLTDLLVPRAGETLLDVGADLDFKAARYAARRGKAAFLVADARCLPFEDRSFDLVISVAALCFVPNPEQALAEMLRVARRRVGLGLLNRRSLLYLAKSGRGAYRGARWHTQHEVACLFAKQRAGSLTLRTGAILPGCGRTAQRIEPCLRRLAPGCGAFIAAAADVPSTYLRNPQTSPS